MLQKFFAAPVDRSFVFPSSALLSRLIVYSSSHLCSLFFILYSLLSSHVVCYLNGALLSAPSSLPSLPAFLFFFLFILILLYTSWHILFVSHSFLSSIQCDSYLRDFIHLFFWHVRLYCRNFFSPYLLIYTVLLFLSTRVLCMLVTFIFLLFITRNVMFLALTWFNFFLVFFLSRALSNLFLSAISPLWFLQLCVNAVSE